MRRKFGPTSTAIGNDASAGYRSDFAKALQCERHERVLGKESGNLVVLTRMVGTVNYGGRAHSKETAVLRAASPERLTLRGARPSPYCALGRRSSRCRPYASGLLDYRFPSRGRVRVARIVEPSRSRIDSRRWRRSRSRSMWGRIYDALLVGRCLERFPQPRTTRVSGPRLRALATGGDAHYTQRP